MKQSIYNQKVEAVFEQVVAWRRHLHQHPELSFQEFETTKFIINILEGLKNLEIKPLGETGVVAVLKGKNPGKTIALRADIDALLINEQVDVEFKSQNENIMHACGHDLHTAMLLGAATILNDMVDEINGEIRFVFQPAEESSPSGAVAIMESGLLDGVEYIFGQHIMVSIPLGKIV